MQAQYGDNFYFAVKVTSGLITSKREELLYATRRDQEGRQREGLFKPLKEWHGKTDESQWATMRRLPHVWPSERGFDEEAIGVVQNWLKTQPANFFSGRIKKLVKRWNRCVEVEGDYVEK
jgi:hypothetical protein